jgi:hypothetical protein
MKSRFWLFVFLSFSVSVSAWIITPLDPFIHPMPSYGINGDTISMKGGSSGAFLYIPAYGDFVISASITVGGPVFSYSQPASIKIEDPRGLSVSLMRWGDTQYVMDHQLWLVGGCSLVSNGSTIGSVNWGGISMGGGGQIGGIGNDNHSTAFKLERKGNHFRAYRAPALEWTQDGTITNYAGPDGWALFAECDVPMKGICNLGFSVERAYEATFSNVKYTLSPIEYQKPVFDTHPMSQTVDAGKTVTFQASADGVPEPTYSWYHSARGWLKSTSNSCIIAKIMPEDAGFVYAYASNSAGVTQSQLAELRVNGSAPVFTLQPTSQTVPAGSSVSFQAQASGFPAPKYKWWSSTRGYLSSTSTVCVLNNVQPSDSGTIYAIAYNIIQAVSSQAAELKVGALMPEFRSYNVSTGRIIVCNYLDSFGVTAYATGGDLKYQWVLNGTNINQATNASLYIQHVGTQHSGVYHVVISNAVGTIIAPTFTVLVNGPPSIARDLQSQTVTAGNDLELSIQLSGTPAQGIDWYFNDRLVSQGTNHSLVIPNMQLANQGQYWAVAWNNWGNTVSSHATINVAPSAPRIITQPQSQTASLVQTVRMKVDARGSNPLGYNWYFNDTLIQSGPGETLMLYNMGNHNVGPYYVEIINAYGKCKSDPAWLTIKSSEASRFRVTNFLGRACSVIDSGDKVIVNGDWGSYVFMPMTGDFEVSASFVMTGNGSGTTNAICQGDVGIMFMERAMRGSKNVYLMRAVECTNAVPGVGIYHSGACYQTFVRADWGTTEIGGAANWNWLTPHGLELMIEHEIPSISFKLVRKDNKFQAFRAPAGLIQEFGFWSQIVTNYTGTDGWARFGECEATMNNAGYVGFYFGEWAGQLTFSNVVFRSLSSAEEETAKLVIGNYGGYAGLDITAVTGKKYAIMSAEDFAAGVASWKPVTSIILTEPSMFWLDRESKGKPKRFYKAILIP